MRSRFISAVTLYGPKSGPVRDFLAGVQATIAAHIGDRFRPYSLDQVHGTLIALDGVPDPATGAIVNEYYRTRTGAARAMDLGRAMDILASHLTPPISRSRSTEPRPRPRAPSSTSTPAPAPAPRARWISGGRWTSWPRICPRRS